MKINHSSIILFHELRISSMSNKFINWTLFVLLCIIWGSSFKLMKDSTASMTASQVAALRIFSAGFVFVPFAFFHFKYIPRKKMGLVILSALLGNLGPAFLFAIAIMRIDGSLAGILNSLTPICVAIIAILFFREKIKSQKIIGVLVGFLGLVLLTVLPAIIGEKDIRFDNLDYTLLILIATLLYGLNVNIVAHYLKELKPLHLATVSLAFMTLPTIIILWLQGFFEIDFGNIAVQHSIIATVILGIVCSAIATVIFYMLVQRAGGLFSSLVTYGIPFVAIGWGLLDNEVVTVLEIVCLCLILLGVYLANRQPRSR